MRKLPDVQWNIFLDATNKEATAMGEWRTDINPGYLTKVIKTESATIEINRPILTEDERRRREETVIQALRAFGKEVLL